MFLGAPASGVSDCPRSSRRRSALRSATAPATASVIDGREQEDRHLTMHHDEAAVLEAVAARGERPEGAAQGGGLGGSQRRRPRVVPATGSRLAFASRPVVDLFMQYAVLDEGADLKRFTDDIYCLDRASLAAILRGLFTADGTVVDSGVQGPVRGPRLHVARPPASRSSDAARFRHQGEAVREPPRRQAQRDASRRARRHEGVPRAGDALPPRDPVVARPFEREIGFVAREPEGRGAGRLNCTVSTYRDELHRRVRVDRAARRGGRLRPDRTCHEPLRCERAGRPQLLASTCSSTTPRATSPP